MEKISTHCMRMPSFIIICIEIAKIGKGNSPPPQVFLNWEKSSQNRAKALFTSIEEQEPDFQSGWIHTTLHKTPTVKSGFQ